MSTLSTITGIYRDGKVELSHRPEGLGENASVLVTFLPATEGSEPVPEAEAARERFLARLKEGIPFGGPPYPKREELHERFERHEEDPR